MTRIWKPLIVGTLAALAVPAFVALAGECSEGFDCSNICPLARQANEHRSDGREAASASQAVRTQEAALIRRNLGGV